MNKSACGETMQNLRKRVDVKLVTNAKDYQNYKINQILFLKDIQ